MEVDCVSKSEYSYALNYIEMLFMYCFKNFYKLTEYKLKRIAMAILFFKRWENEKENSNWYSNNTNDNERNVLFF